MSEGIWFPTRTGARIDVLNIDPDQIVFSDIAHSLAGMPRYCHHTDRTYSVGEHSVRLSYLVPERVAALALMHDAPEYVMADVPRPIKMLVPQYKEIEDRLLTSIFAKFGLLSLAHSVEAVEMWEVDGAFPIVEKKFSGLFPNGDLPAINGYGDTNQKLVDYLGKMTCERFPHWGWGDFVAEATFTSRARELGII